MTVTVIRMTRSTLFITLLSMKKILIFVLSCSLVHCKSSEKFEQNLLQNSCDEALQDLPENQPAYHLMSKAQEVSGDVLSYSAAGAGYTAQAVWNVTASVGAVVILCAPILIIVAAASQGGGSSGSYNGPPCFVPSDITAIWAPPWGSQARKNTEHWNCPDVDGISRSVRRVAQCYATRGGDQNRQKALASLRAVEGSNFFYRCLSADERELFLRDLAGVQ